MVQSRGRVQCVPRLTWCGASLTRSEGSRGIREFTDEADDQADGFGYVRDEKITAKEMIMSKLLAALVAAATLSMAGTAIGQATAPRAPAATSAAMSKDSYNAERDRASATYKADR